LGKRRSLLTNAKWSWGRWLRWAHFFDDEWLQNEDFSVIKKTEILKQNNLRLVVGLGVVEGSEL
jgi:hypothetical protein